MMKLSENFAEVELAVEVANERVKANARLLCEQILEPIRQKFGVIIVTSGYRPPGMNEAVGGKPHSYHLYNEGRAACDFKPADCAVTEVFNWMRLESNLPFDKVILEHDFWPNGKPRVIHVQIDVYNAPRRLAYLGAVGAGQRYDRVEVRS